MTLMEWLEQSKADAVRRGLADLPPILDALANATEALRAAGWNNDADGDTPRDDGEPA
jgi:hypothetical protein